MKKALFLLLLFLFAQCKSDKSYNSVVKEAIKSSEYNDTSIISNAELITSDSTDYNTTISDSVENESTDSLKSDISDVEENIDTKKIKKKRRKAKIEFEEFIYQFGNIVEGDIIEHKFYFTNTGSAPLNIKSSSATCGCTVPSYPFIPVESGDRGYIGVTFNSVGKFGKQTPIITVTSNATEPIIKLRLSGTIVENTEEIKESEVKDSTGTLPQ